MKASNEIKKINNEITLYQCNNCHLWKEASHYRCDKYSKARDGLSTRCKECLYKIDHIHKKYKSYRVAPLKNGKVYCTKCEQYKDPSEFFSKQNVEYRHNRNHVCKECQKKYTNNRFSSFSQAQLLDYFINIRLSCAKSRSAKHGREFNIDYDYIKYLWNKQDGKCAISGLPMTLITGKGKCIYNISLDRIDSSKGYIHGNVQLVCDIVNKMKLNLTENEFIDICSTIIKNYYGSI